MAFLRQCDVVIVGGGVSGAASARALAAAGLDAVLLEQGGPHSSGGSCCGVLTPSAQELAEGLLGDAVRAIYAESFSGLGFHFPKSGLGFNAFFAQGGAHGSARRLERGGLVRLLLEDSGAEVRANSRLLSIREEGDFLHVIAAESGGEMHYRARALVGADGADSTVRSQIYTSPLHYPVFRAMRTVHRVIDNPLSAEMLHLWPEPRYGLLAWAHAFGDRLAVGILREDGEDVGELHERLMVALESDHGVRLAVSDESAEGRVLLGPAVTNRYMPGRGKVLLVGEAAGFINPPIEGISTALSTGTLVGEAVFEALGAGLEPADVYRRRLVPEARACTDRWNPTRMLFGSPHEADLRAGFNSLGQDEQHAVGGDIWRHMKRLRPYGWIGRSLWLGLLRLVMGRYPLWQWR